MDYDICKNGIVVGKIEIFEEEITPVEPTEPIEYVGCTCTKEKLTSIFYDAQKSDIDEFYLLFERYARSFNINNETQEDFFLTQVFSEIGSELIGVRENLNYSCDALKSTFSYYGDNPQEADQDGRCGNHDANQVEIGNKAYGNRLGNGAPSTGDGYHYRGGGYFQITGFDNYDLTISNINEATGLSFLTYDFANNIILTPQGVLASMSFWKQNDMNQCSTIDCTTEIINKYTDSYDERSDNYDWISSL